MALIFYLYQDCAEDEASPEGPESFVCQDWYLERLSCSMAPMSGNLMKNELEIAKSGVDFCLSPSGPRSYRVMI